MSNASAPDDCLDRQPRPLTAPTLALELREAIARWFSARDTPAMQSSELILAALADLAAEQVAANPVRDAQNTVLAALIHDIFRGCNAANRRRMGGVPCIIVKQ